MDGMTAFTQVTHVVATRALYAYLDPGAGSMVLQGILAGIAVGALALRRFWSRILGIVRLGESHTQPTVKDAEGEVSSDSARS